MLIRKLVVGLLVVLLLAGACGVLFREPLIAAGTVFVERYGYAGLSAGVLISDTSVLPLTNEPILLLAVSGGLDPWWVFVVGAGSSIAAGPVGYGLGLALSTTWVAPWLRRKQPEVIDFLTRKGAQLVAIAALLPIPFAHSTWSAGMLRVPFLHVCGASLLRAPKTGFYLWIIVQGWSLGE